MTKTAARIITLDPDVEALVSHYKKLVIGGKEVITPYYMNEKGRRGRRVSVGKGMPQALERETVRLAKKHNFDLDAATSEEIREFMVKHRLGVDCSALVTWAMRTMVRKRTGRSLWKYIWLPGSRARSFAVRHLRPVENISARVLTHEKNARKINDLREVAPGDVVRSLNGKHVLLVSEVGFDEAGNPLYLKYVNSTEYGGIKYGIREGVIFIKDPASHILQQEWLDSENGVNWIYKAANDYPEDTCIVRLKFLEITGQRSR
ncbi:MAG TPA: hypothetical protein VJ836_06230 [Candidatus Saccharimonadales bacterium]|nr:hypothetical protein [Candidatus Saccharimonadales bacterium]